MRALLAGTCLAAPLAQAQTSNVVWFTMWNGQPTPSSDVSVQNITTPGSGSAVPAGSANNFASQTNFPSFNSPYDIAVDTAMGKAYVLDNNANGTTPEYIYSFNLTGTPAQIVASGRIIYTMPVSQVDSNNNLYPLISGIALDPVNHYLYFNQIDSLTSTNSYVGRLSLTSSYLSDTFSPSTNNYLTLQTLYAGQIPGQGSIAVDSSRIYISAISASGNDGVYAAPVSGSGTFSEIVTISSGNTAFPNGFVSGVASYTKSNIVYYLTSNAGYLNHNYNTSQNAIWSLNTASNLNIPTLIASGYQGDPDNITVDPANNRYYFTVGRDGTGNVNPGNYQAIYTGVVGSTAAPTLFYTPVLTGQDTNANAGNVAIQGIYVVDVANNLVPPTTGTDYVTAESNLTITLPTVDLLANDSDSNDYSLSITAVSNPSTNGGSVSLNGNFVDYLPATNYVGNDQFTYTVTDTGGAQAQGTVNVNVVALTIPPSLHMSITRDPTGRFLLFNGTAGQSYMIQDGPTPSGQWSQLSPYLPAGASGIIEYNDPTIPLPATRYYRLHSE